MPIGIDRNARSRRHQHRKGIERQTGSTEAVEFFTILKFRKLLDATERLRLAHRERLYFPTVARSVFMRPAMDADCSC